MRSFVARVEFEGGVGDGVLFSHGDQGGGYIAWLENAELHFSYNAYGDMHPRSCPLPAGVSSLDLRFDVTEDMAWAVTVVTDSGFLLELGPVPMLMGMAPFTGISVGFDGAGPVDWDLHERLGSFRYVGDPFSVTYLPGEKARINREIVRAIDEVSARLMD